MPNRTSTPDTTFAYAYSITPKAKDKWFDPKLHTDTALFVDPFLMFNAQSGPWSTVHGRMIDFFNEALALIAAAGGNHNSKEWRQASVMLSFPEPPQFCLGYSQTTIFGRGSGRDIGTGMLASGERAVRAGIKDIHQFGELMLFGDNFGPDRISDMTCNIVMDLFVKYTQKVAKRHSLPTETFTLPHVGYDFKHGRWNRAKVQLPANPCWDRRTPVLLVPEEYLIDLPVMDDGAFWDWVYSNFSQQLRQELNLTLDANIDKKAIIARAKQSPGIARRYGIRYEERFRAAPPRPYDLAADPKDFTKNFQAAQLYASEATAAAPSTPEELFTFVEQLCTDFKWITEERGLWKNFWFRGQSLREPEVQSLFHAAVVLKCQQLGIDVTPEADAGRGPVDFKFGVDWQRRSIVEMKFAKSKSYWDNLEMQPKTYAVAEGIKHGVFLVIQHEDDHCTSEFEAGTNAILDAVATEAGLALTVIFVDVRPKGSASTLKAPKKPKGPG
jgi:hypothetical protein